MSSAPSVSPPPNLSKPLHILWLLAALAAPLGWLVPLVRGQEAGLTPILGTALPGLAIVGAAFLLSWACELAERDVPPALALIVLGFVSVLPEYAVDVTFAWKAGQDPAFEPFPIANMTGGNRLLVGLGFSMLVFVHWLRTRETVLKAGSLVRLPLAVLLLATLVSLSIQIWGTLALGHTVAFGLLFALYVAGALRSEVEEHEPIGPAALIDSWATDGARWATVGLFLVYACVTLFFAAEPFAGGLVRIGTDHGIDRFLLVQWVAPIASEAPEFIVAWLFVLRGRPAAGLSTLASALVQQWTLLVGAIPLVYSWSRGEVSALVLDARQQEELLLTSALSLFAIALLADLRFTVVEAAVLAGLFLAQWFVPSTDTRYAIAGLCLVGAAFVGLGNRDKARGIADLLRFR